MAELVAAVPPLLRADQAEHRYNEALQTAVAAYAADTEGQSCFICMDGAAEEGLVRGCACRGAAGVAHVSCLARQAERTFDRWHTCGLCEQQYHGVVRCALGWACWKTYLGRPETDRQRRLAINVLGNGLSAAGHDADALSMREAELSMMRRLGAPEFHVLAAQGNLAINHDKLGRLDEALLLKRDVYSGFLRLDGEEHERTLLAANNYALSLVKLHRFEEAKALFRKTILVARRVLGDSHETTLRTRCNYARALFMDTGATLDDLREAVTTLEDTEPRAQRVFGSAHPLVEGIGISLRTARETLAARETSARVETPARLEEALARVDRLERELAKVQRQVAELMRTRADAEAPP